MHDFKQVQINPMIFKSMSSNFLRHALHLMGHIEIYPVVQFSPESMVRKKPMLHFRKITPQGDLSWPSTLTKTLCCACRRFLPSFPLAKALGGLDAKAGNFHGPSKSARELPRGEEPTLSRFGKRYSEEMPRSDPLREYARSGGSIRAKRFGPLRGPSKIERGKTLRPTREISHCTPVYIRFCLRYSAGQGTLCSPFRFALLRP